VKKLNKEASESKLGSKKTRPSKLRSGLEDKVRKQLEDANKEYTYETHKISYTVPAVERSYRPDFIIHTKAGKPIFIESKGRWVHEDQYKHLYIRTQHPDLDIRFIFGRADNTLAKGSRRTYRDVCEGNGYGLLKGHKWLYGDKGIIPESWLTE
jgi:hypothetical protein